MADVVTTRSATPADYNQILKLSDDDRDYLPSKYHDFLRDPNRSMTVLDYNGQVVGFAMGYIVDDGETIVGQGVRFSKSHQKLGIWREMRKASTLNFERPKITHLATVFSDWKANMNIPGTKLLMKRQYIRLAIKDATGLGNPQSVRALSHQETTSLLNDRDKQWQLFPHGFAIIHAVPYSTKCTSNMQTICDNTCKVLTNVGDEESMSFGSYHEAPIGIVYYCDFYGKSVCDLEKHILQQIRHADTIPRKGELYVNVYMPHGIGCSDIIARLGAFTHQLQFVDSLPGNMFMSRYPIPKPKSNL